MADQCKMEFYFKRADIEKLLQENPSAKGIIITHEIVQEKPRGSFQLVNVSKISARVDPAPKKKKTAAPAPVKKGKATQSKLMKGAGDDETPPPPPPPLGNDPVGCPYPPGC